MARKKLTKAEIQKRGMDILVRELGYPNAAAFVLSCSRTGRDYTKERRRLFAGVTLDELIAGTEKIMAKERQRTRRKSA